MCQCTSEKGRDAEAWPPGLCVRPVVEDQDTHRKALKTVQGEISQKANRGEEERSGGENDTWTNTAQCNNGMVERKRR